MPQGPSPGGSAGTALSPNEIGQLISSLAWGFPKDKKSTSYTKFLDDAIAVCLAESGGRPNAENRNGNGSIDYGLWQINSVHSKTFTGNYKGYTDLWPNRYEPVTNTIMAKAIWTDAGGSFSPWSTYKSGAYKKFLGHGVPVHKWLLAGGHIELPLGEGDPLTALGGAINNAASAAGAALNPIGGYVNAALGFAKDAGIAIGVFLLAVVLIILGIWFIVSQTKAGQTATKLATKIPV